MFSTDFEVVSQTFKVASECIPSAQRARAPGDLEKFLKMQLEAFWVHCGRKKCEIFLSVFVHILEFITIITVITRYLFVPILILILILIQSLLIILLDVKIHVHFENTNS